MASMWLVMDGMQTGKTSQNSIVMVHVEFLNSLAVNRRNLLQVLNHVIERVFHEFVHVGHFESFGFNGWQHANRQLSSGPSLCARIKTVRVLAQLVLSN